jgi:protein kinase-like protein
MVGSTQPVATHTQGLLPIAPGTKLGPYEVQEVIGQGAMGIVYRAYHAELERTGAVKVLQALGPDPDSRARFQREAQAIAHMRHPNILNVYDFGDYKGTPYMIVEYVPGGSLADRLQNGPVDREAAIAYLRGIAEGLDHAHSLGIVHRDVKPANVLLGPDDTPILADFGLAKLLESASIRSMTGITTGTPAYMSPEQVTGSDVGPAADGYSLATIAYELLTGAYPFDGEGVLEMLYAHVHREPPPPSSRNPELGPGVDAVVLRGLAKVPAERWHTCGAFVTALAAALHADPAAVAEDTAPLVHALPASAPRAARGLGATAVLAPSVPAARPAGTRRKLEQTVAVAAAPTPVATDQKKSRRSPYVIAGALLILLLLVAGYCGLNANSATTLALSPTIVSAGDQVLVTAGHVPANQSGQIEVHSQVRSFPFHADKNGNVSQTLTVPRDTAAGDHIVRICWSGSCHAQATLRVVAGIALAPSPTASPTPSPRSSPSPTSAPPTSAPPTAAPTAPPTSPPNVVPSPKPTPPPTAPPSPSPSPRPTPTPTPTPPPPPPPPPPPSISLSATHMKMLGGTVTVYGLHFGSGQTVTITFTQGITSQTFTVTTAADGTFTRVITTPATAIAGQATISACDGAGCASQTVTVTLL